MAGKRLVSLAPSELKEVYEPLIGAKHSDHQLAPYIKAADLLDGYLKCVTELQAGNQKFVVAKQQIADSLAQLRMEEVDYFLEHLAPSFAKTLDEISEPLPYEKN